MEGANYEHVYHQFVIRVDAENRDRIRKRLSELGIGTLIHYPQSAHQMPAYQGETIDPGGLKNLLKLIPQILSLPMGTHIELNQASEIAKLLVEVANGK